MDNGAPPRGHIGEPRVDTSSTAAATESARLCTRGTRSPAAVERRRERRKVRRDDHRRAARHRPPRAESPQDLRPASRGLDVAAAPQRPAKTPAPIVVKIATFNARTLKAQSRLFELVNLASEQRVDIVALQEHRRVLDQTTTSFSVGRGWVAHLCSARPDGSGGVGFLLAPKANAALLRFTSHHARITSIDIDLDDNRIHIMNCHLPTACAPSLDETESCLDIMQQFIQNQPTRDITLLAGDFNADIPADGDCIHNSHPYPLRPSAHVECVIDFIAAHNLVATNGVARQHNSRKHATFHGPRHRHARLDYVFSSRTWTRLLRRVQIVTPRTVPSDHDMVIATFSLKLWLPRASQKKQRPPFWAALHQPQIRRRFIAGVLAQPNDDYAGYVRSIHAAADKFLPKRKPKQAVCMWDEDRDVLQARRRLMTAKQHSPSTRHWDLEKALDDTYKRRSEEIMIDIAREITTNFETRKSRAVWQGIEKLTGRKARPATIVAADNMSDRMKLFKDHFQSILNTPQTGEELQAPTGLPTAPDVVTGPFSEREVAEACGSIACGKASGDDGVPSDVARLTTLANAILRPTFNSILEGNPPPREFLSSVIVAIPKKGNDPAISNQRGISLMQTNAKLFNRLLLTRIRYRFEQLIQPLQAGFRQERSTEEQVLALRIVIDTCRSRKKNLVVVFVDYSKAFDSVDRSALERILGFYGLQPEMTAAVMSLYTGTQACVRCPSGTTESFATTGGVLQGDTLAPYLFIICMDYVFRQSIDDRDAYTVRRRLSTRKPAVKLPLLAYADDAALLSDSATSAQNQLQRFETVSQSVGLRLNATKTEVLFVGENPIALTSLSGVPLPICNDFTYLGCKVMDSGVSFASRRRLAWAAAVKLNSAWRSPACDSAKVQLFSACVESVLFYGTGALTTTQTLENRINASHRQLLRHALNVHYPAVIRNQDVYDRDHIQPAATTLRTRRLALLGHIMRRPGTPLATVVHPANQPTEPWRVGGHRRTTHIAVLLRDLENIDITLDDAQRLSQNRVAWARRIRQQ